jgi:arylsulfatase A-like enzyme
MSPWEFRTYTAARGPAFKSGEVLDIPTGHPDLAPTFLRILGLSIPEHMEGRAIEEALAGAELTTEVEIEDFEAERILPTGTYHQRLTLGRMQEGPWHLTAAHAGINEPVEAALERV